MKKEFRLLLVGVAASQLMSCASLELIAAGGVSYLLTGKGLSDHALSMTMDEDCAFHRVLFDEPLCAPDVLTNETSDVLIAATQDAEQTPGTDKNTEVMAAVTGEASTLVADDSLRQNQGFAVSEDNALLPSGVESIDSFVNVDLPNESLSEAQIYAVVGSFNDLKYAFERSTLYRIYNTHIIEAPKDSGVRYRVVIGPLQDKGLIEHIPQKSDIDTNPHWAVELCEDSLSPPPCEASLLAKN